MRYLKSTQRPKDFNHFLYIFYGSGFKKENLIEMLSYDEVVTEQELKEMSLPLIFATYHQDCWELVIEEISAAM